MPRRLTHPLTLEPLYPANDTMRLEPLPRSDEVASGLAARVHDAAWLLTRQWQFGEFAGQDAGSPVLVSLEGDSHPVTAWRPRPEEGEPPPWRRYQVASGPLDRLVEAESSSAPDERTRVEGGAHLVALLHEAGHADAVAVLLGTAGFTQPVGAGDGSLRLLAEAVPDAAAVAERVAAGEDAGPGTSAVLTRWATWWKQLTAGSSSRVEAFDEHRFEHRLEISVGDDVLRADEYLSDGLDWHSVDRVEGTPAPAGTPYHFTQEALPTPVRYGGLPADRFWEMEDAQVDLASAEVSTLDTGRLLLIGFASVYGNDWFMAPLEVPVGSLTTISALTVRDSFGDTWPIGRAGGTQSGWNLFTVTGKDAGLLVLPTSQGVTGAPLETVALARDELANTAWAIETSVTDDRGGLVDRREAWLRSLPATPEAEPGALPAYAVQTVVPDYWLPLSPEATGPETIRFRLLPLVQPGTSSAPAGRLMAPGQWVHEEEVPREGAQLTRRPVLARWYDGSWCAWTRREKNAGSGESSSGLAFDVVRPSDPWP